MFLDAIFVLTRSAIQLLDYDAARNKLRKVVDKPGEDGLKLPKVYLYPMSLHYDD